MRNFHLNVTLIHKSMGTFKCKLNESYTKHYVHGIAFPLVSIMFHMVHTRSLLWRSETYWWNSFVWLAGSIFGLHGISYTRSLPHVMEGWDTLVELTGRFPAADGVALLVKAGGSRLSTGKAGISGAWRFELKGWWECDGTFPTAIPFFAFSFQLKIGRLRLGFDHWSSPSQYGIVRKLYPIWFRFLGWLINCTSFPYISMHFFHENTGCPGSSSIGEWVEVLGWHFISSFLILDVSTVFPMLDGIWGSEVLSFLPVRASSGDGRLPAMGSTLYWSSP